IPSERPSEVQPTPSPIHISVVPLVPQTDPSPTHTSEVPVEPQTDPSSSPSPSTAFQILFQKVLVGILESMDEECLLEAKISKKEILKETMGAQRAKDAQDVGRTRDVVDEEEENDEDVLSTEDVLSIAQQKVSADKEKVSTDKPIVSTDGSKVSTDRPKDSTDEQIEGTDKQRKGTDDHTKERSATQTTQPPTSTIFGDDETIAKIDTKDKGKKKIEEEDESESESDGIPKAERKFKQLASDEEMARKVQEEWEGKEERKRLVEEEATN
ncbi:hypothetical protein Tco_0023160, partial [Tanacetum coccineum]